MRRQGGGGRRKTEEGKGRIGSTLDDFLKEEGIYEEVSAHVIKRVLARQADSGEIRRVPYDTAQQN